MSEHKEHISSTTWSKVALAAVMSKVALVNLLAYCHHCLTQHRFFYPRCQILMVQIIAATNTLPQQQSSVFVSHTLLPEDLSKTALNTAVCNCSRSLDNSLSLSSILLVILSLTLTLTLALALALPLTLVALILPLVLVLHHT